MSLEDRLNSIPFGSLIGGPLCAAIEAQGRAAVATVDFIRSVGLEGPAAGAPAAGANEFKVRNVSFSYSYTPPPPSAGANPPPAITRTIQVPLLTIVPVPFIRLDSIDIGFKASLSESSEEKKSEAQSRGYGAEVEAGGSYLFFKASLKASVSSKRDSSSTKNSKYSVEYTMDVNVRAVQDDVPAGLSKVLGLLTGLVEKQIQ